MILHFFNTFLLFQAPFFSSNYIFTFFFLVQEMRFENCEVHGKNVLFTEEMKIMCFSVNHEK